jgi:hypothetical protein
MSKTRYTLNTIRLRALSPLSLLSLLATGAVALLITASPLRATAQEHPSGKGPDAMEKMHEHMHEHMQERMQEHLDHLAARLEIRASQQEAWNAFAGAVKGLAPAQPPQKPAHDLDAAARARLAADRAAEMARKLSTLADATGRLQQALDAPQKQVLNEVSREFAHRMHGRGMGHEHGMGEGPMMGMHGHDGPEHCEGMHERGHGMMEHEGHGPEHDGHGGARTEADEPSAPGAMSDSE